MTLFEFYEKDFIDTNKNGVVSKYRAMNMNIVLSVIANNIMHKGVDENGYTLIYSRKFKEKYSGYKVYLDYLIDQGKLDRSFYIKKCDSPTNEGVPYGFRFTEPMKNELQIFGIVLHFNESPKIKKKGENEHADDQNFINPELSKRLLRDLKSCKVDYNYRKQQLDKPFDKWNRFIDIGKWLRDNEELFRLQKKDIWYEQKSYRLYTNFVSLSGKYRKNNILLNDEHLIEYDITNSFPLMIPVLCLSLNPSCKLEYDFKEYCTSVINGTFYTDLTFGLNRDRNCGSKGNVNAVSKRLVSRDEVKEIYQHYLNGKKDKNPFINNNLSLINEHMRFKYPSIHEVVQSLKEGCDDKSVVYFNLVKIETDFIFGVIEEVYHAIPKAKILTCHDSISFPVSIESGVEEIWNRRLIELTKDLPHEDTSEYNNDGEFNDPLGDEMFEYMVGDENVALADDVKKVLFKQKFDYKDFSFLDEEDDDEEDDFWK